MRPYYIGRRANNSILHYDKLSHVINILLRLLEAYNMGDIPLFVSVSSGRYCQPRMEYLPYFCLLPLSVSLNSLAHHEILPAYTQEVILSLGYSSQCICYCRFLYIVQIKIISSPYHCCQIQSVRIIASITSL